MKMITAMRNSKAAAPMPAPIPALAPVDSPPESSEFGDDVPPSSPGGAEVVLTKRKPGVKGCVSKMERSDDCHRICIRAAELMPELAEATDGQDVTAT